MKRIILILLAGLATTAYADVGFERLVNAAGEPHNWLTYSGTYRSERYSPLSQINKDNVADLKVIWAYQMQPPSIGGAGLVETTPIVVDGTMYITEPPSTVTALDARSGKRLWTWSPEMDEETLHIGFPMVNRGVAILDDAVYVGTLDAHLVALDAASGAVRWDIEVADNALNYSLTLAPLAIDGKIIIGVSGAEAGIRGFIDAYDSATGERIWRIYTIPAPGEPGSETWQGDDWQTGGGSTWLTGSYDPELDLLYWTVGNPAPDWNGDLRPGDNLYSCSVLALDPVSGEMKWYFQFTPHVAKIARYLHSPTATLSSTCLIVKLANSCTVTSIRNRPGPLASTRRAGPLCCLARIRPKKATSSGRACRARPTGSALHITRTPSNFLLPPA
jgi:alcohol dehydrogenase (cytochrome c)